MISSRARWLALVALSFAVLCFGQGKRTAEPPEERDQPVERERWFRRGRPSDGGQAAEKLHRAFEQKLAKRAARRQSSQERLSVNPGAALTMAPQARAAIVPAPGAWTPLGPSPLASDSSGSGQQDYGWVTGRATAVAVDQNDPSGNTVYLGGAFGGLWKSTNAAGPVASVQWSPLIDHEATLAVGAIALKPDNSSVVLVGTGESNSSVDSYYGLGFLRSASGGTPGSWTLITSANGGTLPLRGLTVSRIAFSTDNPTLVVASTAAAGVNMGQDIGSSSGTSCTSGATCRGMYYSTDAGASWTHAASITDSGAPVSVGSAHSVIYNPAQHKFYTALRAHGIYSSPDGVTWTRTSGQPGTISLTNCPTIVTSSSLTGCPLYRAELAIVPGRDEIYVWYVNSDDVNGGVYQSLDGGNTWTALSVTGMNSCGDGTNNGCGTEQGTYNLALAAVPNGSGTDVYAGAVNEFKCTINNPANPATCTFINLTHVYGCSPVGSYSHVHPDEHSIDFLHSNPAIIYFANDGGIYHTLNSFLTGVTGNCGSTPTFPFQNLNGTMGSMTQFVSFSQHPSDSTTLLGGTQDNGSPATSNAGSSPSWGNVNNGDGGYNEINPDNPGEWFTANTYVSIQRCASGINCHSGDFLSRVTSTTVGGDSGSFYVPYMLDPQNSGTLLVGTCRLWRGGTSGSGFAALSSPNFNSTLTAACPKGDATNPAYIPDNISTLAAGGPKGTNNNSRVIYAGTEGYTDNSGNAAGGKIWVTTNADSGTSTWVDRTGSINPRHYPISSIALDPSDSTGMTAYATIMGFDVSHVFRTTNGGTSWADISGTGSSGLPNAPVNAVVVDPGVPNIVYVGTDVGVYFTSDGGANWEELGASDTFPNVAVTRLRIFSGGTTEHLRVSTYGRGIWDIDLGLPTTATYMLTVPNSEVSVVANQPGSVSGTLTPMYGYSGNITVSCAGTVPATCTGASFSGVRAVTNFTVAVANPTTGDFNFTIQARDANGLTQTQNAIVHVVDFTLDPSPPSRTVRAGVAAPYTLTLAPTSGNGPANASIAFTCSDLPPLSTCSFAPATLALGTASGQTTLSINTTAAVASAQPVQSHAPLYAYLLPVAALAMVGLGARRRKGILLPLVITVFLLVFLQGCGGGGNKGGTPGTPTGTYSVIITGTMSSGGSAQGSHTTTVTLTVQ